MIKIDILYNEIDELNIFRMKLLKILKEKDTVIKEQYNFITSRLEINFIQNDKYYHISPLNGEILYKKYNDLDEKKFEEIKDLVERIYKTTEVYVLYHNSSWLNWNRNYKVDNLNEFEIKAINEEYQSVFYSKEDMIKYINNSIDNEISKKMEDIEKLKCLKI